MTSLGSHRRGRGGSSSGDRPLPPFTPASNTGDETSAAHLVSTSATERRPLRVNAMSAMLQLWLQLHVGTINTGRRGVHAIRVIIRPSTASRFVFVHSFPCSTASSSGASSDSFFGVVGGALVRSLRRRRAQIHDPTVVHETQLPDPQEEKVRGAETPHRPTWWRRRPRKGITVPSSSSPPRAAVVFIPPKKERRAVLPRTGRHHAVTAQVSSTGTTRRQVKSEDRHAGFALQAAAVHRGAEAGPVDKTPVPCRPPFSTEPTAPGPKLIPSFVPMPPPGPYNLPTSLRFPTPSMMNAGLGEGVWAEGGSDVDDDRCDGSSIGMLDSQPKDA